MSPTLNRRCRAPLALGIACALALPWAAQAQTSTSTTGNVSAREQQLEQRVDQLEQQLAQLKAMIQAQKQQPAQPASAAPAQNVAAVPATAAKPVFTTAPGVSVALHGFVSATAFSQDKSFTFGNGTNAEFPVPGAKGSLSGVDVRNTRFWLDFSGAKFAGDWVGGGRIEMDFFGGFNGTGPYSQQQPTPRLRQAYMDLTNPNTGTTVRVGQQWELMFPVDNTPVSLAHIAFPLGFAAGYGGWRFPGIVVMQDLNHGSDGAKWRLDLGAFEGAWKGPGDNVNYLTAGNAGFRPQLEARLRVADKNWVAYAAAHYSEVNLKGVGDTAPAPVKDTIQSVGYEVGGSWKPGPWVFNGLVYTGKGLGEIFGAMAQFGDISESGGFVQAGYNFTSNWSAYAFYGISKPDSQDVIRWMGNGSTGLLKNRQAALSLQYAAGAYALGVEWMYDKLDSTTDGIHRKTTNGNQLSVSGMYKF
ncbi:hypothetical protein B0E52_13245 [Rhodanobacter sp. C06]|uniref:carbohydrate porin n=1 Tax=Rhodanobacter sp. C06 TaxID=1945854 RepID=UPI000986F4BD|nr:carbohydrate porin [Rhodanobacter sp. C06]OOG39060.1 hypothetical protein B0E52_13245 [Rhodanobacter sp. C06]